MAGFEKQVHLQENYNNDKISNNFYYGVVINISDPLDSYRIQVRIKGVDDKYSDNDLPWCAPFMPIFLNILPQLNELVKIFIPKLTEPLTRREFLGPYISSVQTLLYDSSLTSLSNSNLSSQTPNKAISNIPSANGAYPSKKDIALQGRDNTDIILKEKEILIRAGKFIYNDNTILNNTNPSYIQIKLTKDGKQSYANLVADNIYLITHKGTNKYDAILTDKTLALINEIGQHAVLGNNLVKWMKLITANVAGHLHAPELPQDIGSPNYNELVKFDFNSVLSTNIIIN